jgi:hypothetical protein
LLEPSAQARLEEFVDQYGRAESGGMTILESVAGSA